MVTCDSSVLVAALHEQHPRFAECRRVVATVEMVPAHVLLETYSVLTRLPGQQRISPAVARETLERLSWRPVQLRAEMYRQVMNDLAANHIGGGATYDALIGATAAHHGLTLLTRDARAVATYTAVNARIEVLTQ